MYYLKSHYHIFTTFPLLFIATICNGLGSWTLESVLERIRLLERTSDSYPHERRLLPPFKLCTSHNVDPLSRDVY